VARSRSLAPGRYRFSAAPCTARVVARVLGLVLDRVATPGFRVYSPDFRSARIPSARRTSASGPAGRVDGFMASPKRGTLLLLSRAPSEPT
jgi:hypothetical protein